MFNRWFIVAVLLVTIGSLVFVIYQDSRDRSGTDLNNQTPPADDYKKAGEPTEPSKIDYERVAYVITVLDTLKNPREKLPYLGELVMRYSDAGQFGNAAVYAQNRAVITGEAHDWKEAGDLYLEQVRRGVEEEISKNTGKKAESMYIEALERKPGDTDLKTDLAVVYMSLLKPDKSYETLMQVLEKEPDHIRANFNAGVLLHQMGNTEQSISYFDRATVLADEETHWKEMIQGYLNQYHQEIYH